jgi:hypothetical protein
MRRVFFVAFAVSTLVAGSGRAGSPPAEARPMAVGVQLDLFPTVVSAVNGRLGHAPQVWLGIDHVRLRLIGAHLEPPAALAFADEGFKNPTTTVFAVVFDYTFGERFDGPWISTGFESWVRTLEHEGVAGDDGLRL